MMAGILGFVVFWLTRRTMTLLWDFPGPADFIIRGLPAGVRRAPGLRTALTALNRSSRDMDDFLVGYRQRNPDVAELADRLREEL